MKVYKRKTLVTMYIIAAVLAVVQIIAMMAMNGGLSGFGDNVGTALIVFVVGMLLLPFVMVALFLNWSKILIGMIAPIPIISFMKQWYINGIIYAIKAFIVVIRNNDRLVIRDDKAIIDGNVDDVEVNDENA